MHFIISKQSVTVRSLYGRNNVNPLIACITVVWLVHMCKHHLDVDRDGVESDIARTYQGWSRRVQLCYQLHMAMKMTQTSFWGYQIFVKNESCVFQQNSNKILKTKNLHIKYKVCICHNAYVWKVKRSYGVLWLYLDSVDKEGFTLKTPFWYFTHNYVANDLRRTLAILGTKVKFKLEAWTLHYFSTHYPPSFIKRW